MAPQGAVLISWLLILSPALRLAGASETTTSTPFTPVPPLSQAQGIALARLLRRVATMGDLRCFCLPRWPTEGQGQATAREGEAAGPSTQGLFPLFTNLNPPPLNRPDLNPPSPIRPDLNPPAIIQPPIHKRIDAITGNRMTSYKPGREPWRVQVTTTCRNSFMQQFPFLLRQDC